MAEERESVSKSTVCVTGAGGYLASWLVKRLLQRGYTVKGALRNPDDPKNSHLKSFEGAEERLILCKYELHDYTSLLTTFKGCDGVFHTASPVIDDMEQMLEASVEGTKNVVNACAEVGVRRVVFTSSMGAAYMNPLWSPDMVIDETCWSNLDFCKDTKHFYCYGKTMAEQIAWKLSKEKGVYLVVVIPAVVVGPMLQSVLTVSNWHILKYLNGTAKTYVNATQAYVDVRNVAEAHILVFENPSACGRYLCVDCSLHRAEVVQILTQLFPQYSLPTKCSDEGQARVKSFRFSNQRLKDLGLQFIPVKQSLYETVKSFQEKGDLPLKMVAKL